MDLTQRQLVTGSLIAAGLLVIWCGVRAAPGGVKVPARMTADKPSNEAAGYRAGMGAIPPDLPVVGPSQMIGGYVFTPHRYPPACGNDITVLIHRGMSVMQLPSDRDAVWMAAPPGEADL